MTGFSHDVAGGNGALIATQVKSPNFVHGSTGWAIFRDGSAEFHDIILPSGSGGATVYFDSVQPPAPNVGDLWYDTANDLQLSQWNGTSWVAYQYGANAIANGAITSTQISSSAGITAGQVSFSATQIGGITVTIGPPPQPSHPNVGDIWQNTTSGKLFQYNGSTFVQFQYGANAIANGAITSTQIAANAGITGSQLADLTVTVSKFDSPAHQLY